MKRFFLITALVLLYTNVYAQRNEFKKPDYDIIKEETQDSTSVYYYPKLLSRFYSSDSTLRIEDFRYLYYGYIFHKDYNPYWTSPYKNKLGEYYSKNELSKSDYNLIIYYGNKSLMSFPFDLVQMDIMIFSYYMLGDKNKENELRRVFLGLLSAILSSGNGETCETGYHVINLNHEYEILKIMRLNIKNQVVKDNCDFFELEENDSGKEGMFFDISKLVESQKDKTGF